MENPYRLTERVVYLMVFLMMLSCDGSKEGKLSRSSGKTAEILVVTDNGEQWDGEVGDSIRSCLQGDYALLPQSEPMFELAHIPISNFTGTKMFRSHHSILIAEIDDSILRPLVEAKKDYWARPQTVIRLASPTDTGLVRILNDYREGISDQFIKSERERLQEIFGNFGDHKLGQKVREAFGFYLTIPKGFYLASEGREFMWIRQETEHHSQGLIIYAYDYTDTSAFHPERIIAFRNAITREHIPGPSANSYMTVSDEVVGPEFQAVDFNGIYAMRASGLWKVVGDFMGGPFLSYTMVNEKNDKVITLDVYVYAPNAPKRDLLMQLDAIAYSLKFN
ncbi:MAG: DUF4837 family protein [Bacteroidales bacterium]|nr:DUF4837 family protein [Bacteroidales bacterium]